MTSFKILSAALILACTSQTFGSDKFPEYHSDQIRQNNAINCYIDSAFSETITDFYGNELPLHGEQGIYTVFKNSKECGFDIDDIETRLFNVIQLMIMDNHKQDYFNDLYNKLDALHGSSSSSSSAYASQFSISDYGSAGGATYSSSSYADDKIYNPYSVGKYLDPSEEMIQYANELKIATPDGLPSLRFSRFLEIFDTLNANQQKSLAQIYTDFTQIQEREKSESVTSIAGECQDKNNAIAFITKHLDIARADTNSEIRRLEAEKSAYASQFSISDYGSAGGATYFSSSVSVQIPAVSTEEKAFLRTLEIEARKGGVFSTLFENYKQATVQKQNESFQLYQTYLEKFQGSSGADAIASLITNTRLFQ